MPSPSGMLLEHLESTGDEQDILTRRRLVSMLSCGLLQLAASKDKIRDGAAGKKRRVDS